MPYRSCVGASDTMETVRAVMRSRPLSPSPRRKNVMTIGSPVHVCHQFRFLIGRPPRR